MLEYVCCFIAGAFVSRFFAYLTSLGYSIIILKEAQKNCAELFLTSEQGLQEILQLKYMTMEEAKRTHQNITSQKYIDQMNIDSIRKTIMRNYVRTFPNQYEHSMEYTTWEEMEDYVNNITKEEKRKNQNDQTRKKI